MQLQLPTKRVAIGALATGAFATGARSIGAFMVGAFAVGTFMIRRLSIRNVKIHSLEIDELKFKRIPSEKAPFPSSGIYLTHFLTVTDPKRSARFYAGILGGEVVREGEPTIVKLANSWMILNVGGGPTDDKPGVFLRPPQSTLEVSSFLNIRVADIAKCYFDWKSKGVEFLTEPKDHEFEIRCYMKDPDGYLIEVGESKAEAVEKAA